MTDSEKYRLMGDYIKRHGFSPEYWGVPDFCGCFLHAAEIGCGIAVIPNLAHLANILGTGLGADGLVQAGWREDADSTRDAAAACYMAADLAAEDERSKT